MLTINPNAPALWLHTNACGDFTLLHRDAWEKIRGYAEFEMFSLHLDSLGIATAHHSGFRETWFPPPAVCYHIEHALGSGLTQENHAPLFERIEQQGISWFDYEVIEHLLKEKVPSPFNTEKWGLRDISLDETICTREGLKIQRVPKSLQTDPYASVTALQPQLNTDRYFRKALKHLTQPLASVQARAVEDDSKKSSKTNGDIEQFTQQVSSWFRKGIAELSRIPK